MLTEPLCDNAIKLQLLDTWSKDETTRSIVDIEVFFLMLPGHLFNAFHLEKLPGAAFCR